MYTVDFHTHIFPDALAPKAMQTLMKNSEDVFNPVTDMTLASLLQRMDEWKIDVSVVQPVLTKASQLNTTNEWARSICSDRIVSFGGIYPHSEDYKADIDFVCSLGLQGLKFHCEYQSFTLDEPRMLPIYDYALSKGLILLFHGGYDPGFKPPYHTSPKQFAHVADEMKGGTIVAAHFGGHAQWDDVERYLVGTNVYLDTSMGFEYFSKEQFLRIVKAHGANKILFATDSPWSNTIKEKETLLSMPLTQEEKALILGENAKRLLKL